MTPDALIEALSSIVETTKLGDVIYRNAAGEYHRTAGPAVVTHTGEQHWFQNGIRYWYLNGEEVSEEEFSQRIASGEYLEP